MEETPRLHGKVALVTGAGSGIGRATAIELARNGAKVGLLSRRDENLQQLRELIQNQNGEATPLPADISAPDQMSQSVQTLVEAYGRLDIVFANAGINGVWAPIEQLSPEDFARTIDINLAGTFYTIKYAVPHLKKQGGAIVITSSVNGTRMFSNVGATAYACSKGAQAVMAKMLALELAPFKIRVNAICPGTIATHIEQSTDKRDLEAADDMVKFPHGRIPLTNGKPGTAQQVAKLVLFLVSDQSDHITGTEVWIDGAQSILQG